MVTNANGGEFVRIQTGLDKFTSIIIHSCIGADRLACTHARCCYYLPTHGEEEGMTDCLPMSSHWSLVCTATSFDAR